MFPPCPLPAALTELAPLHTPAAAATAGPKAERDAQGDWANTLSSANFVVKWGSSGGVEPAEAQEVLDLFEAAWGVEIEEMGHAPPAGADVFLFNVYLADTGDGAPPSHGYAGYYTVDDEGWPMVVLNPDTIEAGYAAGVSAHEFYHAVQHTTGAYLSDPAAAWWWEATAMWMEGEVWPDDPGDASFTFGFALAPQLPLWYDEPFVEGNLAEYHPYGAFLFPRYLSEAVGGRPLVTGTWTDPAGASTPQAALAARIDFWSTWADFLAANAGWDYTHGERYAANVDTYREQFRDDPDFAEVAGRLTGPGAAGGLEAHGGGAVVVELIDPGVWVWTATVAPVDGVDLVGAVVRDTPTGASTLVMDPDAAGGLGATWTAGAADGTTRLVVGVSSASDGPYSLTVQVDHAEVPAGEPEDTGELEAAPTACGCGSGPGGAGWGVSVAAAGLVFRRRRVRPRGPSARSPRSSPEVPGRS